MVRFFITIFELLIFPKLGRKQEIRLCLFGISARSILHINMVVLMRPEVERNYCVQVTFCMRNVYVLTVSIKYISPSYNNKMLYFVFLLI